MNFKIPIFLFVIIVLSLFLRFLYFPENIYFGIDQATGSYAVQEILKGHPKLIGPSTTFPGLRHGVLYYYLYAPFYFLGHGDPAFAAAFLRVVNVTGVILIFILASLLFNKYVGLIAGYLFAVSFEQTQFALYFNHPSLAVVSILVMLIGLAYLIFQKKETGLILALLGLGLSFQFEFLLIYLTVPFAATLFFFKKSLPKLSKKTILLGLLSFAAAVSTYVIAEIKFNFRSFYLLPQLLFGNQHKSVYKIISTYFFELGQVIRFNLTGSSNSAILLGLVLLGIFVALIFSGLKKKMIFLGIWFFSVAVTYIVTGGEDLKVDILQYHQNVGISFALIIFVSYLLYILGKKFAYMALLIIVLITVVNLNQIITLNLAGSMPQINAQSFMILSDEKKVMDYIYKYANGKKFAVKAITMPYNINTTWSYLFGWYGKQKYGNLPIWGGDHAIGYPNDLTLETAQDKLPETRFLIIEPTRGIPAHLINDFLRKESYFTDLEEEHKIGKFVVQIRKVKKII